MRRTLFTTLFRHITVSVLLFDFFGVLAAPALKRQALSDRTYAEYQISDGIGGTAEVEAGAIISGTSLFLSSRGVSLSVRGSLAQKINFICSAIIRL